MLADGAQCMACVAQLTPPPHTGGHDEGDYDDEETFDVDAAFGASRDGYQDEREHWQSASLPAEVESPEERLPMGMRSGESNSSMAREAEQQQVGPAL